MADRLTAEQAATWLDDEAQNLLSGVAGTPTGWSECLAEAMEAGAAALRENERLRAALRWALDYGTFDVAVDNPLHGRSLDDALALARPPEGSKEGFREQENRRPGETSRPSRTPEEE